jgi:hypothetical protein
LGQLPGEFQVVRTLHGLVRLLGQISRQGQRKVVGLLLRHRTFIGAGLDLVQQHVPGPSKTGGGAEVIEAGGGLGEFVQDQQILSPGDFCD